MFIVFLLTLAGRVVNASGPILEMMTGEMYESDSIQIRLVVRKDGRIADSFMEVYIAAGDPPIFGIQYVLILDIKSSTE